MIFAARTPRRTLLQQVEIKIYKQRVKHLLYEQQNDVTAKKMSAEVSLKLAQVREKARMYFLLLGVDMPRHRSAVPLGVPRLAISS